MARYLRSSLEAWEGKNCFGRRSKFALVGQLDGVKIIGTHGIPT